MKVKKEEKTISKKIAVLFLVAGCCAEVAYVATMKLTMGYTVFLPSVLNMALALLSCWFVNRAIIGLPIGSSYAIWTACGAAGAVVIGILFFNETVEFWRLFFVFVIVAGVTGLNLMEE